jgi:hypothetical protein
VLCGTSSFYQLPLSCQHPQSLPMPQAGLAPEPAIAPAPAPAPQPDQLSLVLSLVGSGLTPWSQAKASQTLAAITEVLGAAGIAATGSDALLVGVQGPAAAAGAAPQGPAGGAKRRRLAEAGPELAALPSMYSSLQLAVVQVVVEAPADAQAAVQAALEAATASGQLATELRLQGECCACRSQWQVVMVACCCISSLICIGVVLPRCLLQYALAERGKPLRSRLLLLPACMQAYQSARPPCLPCTLAQRGRQPASSPWPRPAACRRPLHPAPHAPPPRPLPPLEAAAVCPPQQMS